MGRPALLEDTEALDADLAECADLREEIEQGWAFLSYANGLMTAAAAGPEFIPPAEWLSEVFDPADADMSDEDTRLANETMESGYRRIVESLNEPDSAYEPFFWTDGEGRLITRDWAEGFFAGIRLREEQWSRIQEGDGVILFAMLAALLQDEDVDAKIAEDGVDTKELFGVARESLPDLIQALHGLRSEQPADRGGSHARKATIPGQAARARRAESAV